MVFQKIDFTLCILHTDQPIQYSEFSYVMCITWKVHTSFALTNIQFSLRIYIFESQRRQQAGHILRWKYYAIA